MLNTNRRWPYGFLDELWQYYEPGSDESTLTLDMTNDKELIGTIEYVLTVCDLSDREKQILRKHYQYHVTYNELGQEFGITNSRAREIALHALRKLRRNSLYKGILLHGVAAYARQNYEIKLDYEFNRRVDERVEQIRKDERECRKRGLQFRRLKAKNSGGDVTEKSQITDLDLSVRSFNALLRSGKRTVADILDIKDRDSLMSIKCLGVKSANEILSKLAGRGFDVGHLV